MAKYVVIRHFDEGKDASQGHKGVHVPGDVYEGKLIQEHLKEGLIAEDKPAAKAAEKPAKAADKA